MNIKARSCSTLLPLACMALAAGSAQAANVIVNGDFETGTLTGWTQPGSQGGTTVSGTAPLAGNFSAVQTRVTDRLVQSFTPITTVVTTSFLFNTINPTGAAGDRGLNVTLRDVDTDSATINLRLLANGNIEIFSTALGNTWQPLLTNAATYGTTTAFSLTINAFGTDFDYDVTVGSQTATGLSFLQGTATFDELDELSFVNSALFTDTSLKIDNVSVVPIPEPTAALLGSLGALLLLRRRR